MGKQLITKRKVVLGAANSLLTGNPFWAGDYDAITISIQSSTASASRYTILGTNLDGFQSTLSSANPTIPAGGWSIVTTITSQGIYTIDPGVRWLMPVRDNVSVSASSNATFVFEGRT